MDVIVFWCQDSVIVIVFVGYFGYIELVDFIVCIDIVQFYVMLKGVDFGVEVGFVCCVQQGGIQIDYCFILWIVFQGVLVYGQFVVGVV